MKNKEKFDNYDDALMAFYTECSKHVCSSCPYAYNGKPLRCDIRWLYTETEPKPTPQWQENIMGKFSSKE